MIIWKSYMRTAEWRKPEKNSGLYSIQTFDLYDTDAALYQY